MLHVIEILLPYLYLYLPKTIKKKIDRPLVIFFSPCAPLEVFWRYGK